MEGMHQTPHDLLADFEKHLSQALQQNPNVGYIVLTSCFSVASPPPIPLSPEKLSPEQRTILRVLLSLESKTIKKCWALCGQTLN